MHPLAFAEAPVPTATPNTSNATTTFIVQSPFEPAGLSRESRRFGSLACPVKNKVVGGHQRRLQALASKTRQSVPPSEVVTASDSAALLVVPRKSERNQMPRLSYCKFRGVIPRRGRNMAGGRPPVSFTCPNCHALYQLVKVEAGPETTFHDVACRACGVPLPGREDTFAALQALMVA
jgi:hypothetical protein